MTKLPETVKARFLRNIVPTRDRFRVPRGRDRLPRSRFRATVDPGFRLGIPDKAGEGHAVPRHQQGATAARALAYARTPRRLPRPLGRHAHVRGRRHPPDHVRPGLRHVHGGRQRARAPRDPPGQSDVARRDLPDLRPGGERSREERTRPARQAALPDPRPAGQAAAARPRLRGHRRDARAAGR